MKIKVSTLRKIIREELSNVAPRTQRGIAPQTMRGVAPQHQHQGAPESGSIDAAFDSDEEQGPMTMRGLGLGGDEVWDTSDDSDLEDVSPETQRSPLTDRGQPATMDDIYGKWE